MSQAETVLHWDIKDFGHLSVGELYDILRLRAEVFIVERHYVYQDLDGINLQSHILTGLTASLFARCASSRRTWRTWGEEA